MGLQECRNCCSSQSDQYQNRSVVSVNVLGTWRRIKSEKAIPLLIYHSNSAQLCMQGLEAAQSAAVKHLALTHESNGLGQYAKVGGCPGGRLASRLVDVCANSGRGHPACSGASQCPPAAQAHLLSLPAHRLQTYAQLLVEVANGRDLREAVKAAAKDVGVDLGGWMGGSGWGV